MHTAAVIARMQLSARLSSPLTMGMLAGFCAFVAVGALGYDRLLLSGVASMAVPLRWIAGAVLVLGPVLTMDALAPTQDGGLWATLPVRSRDRVLGCWFGALGVLTAALGTTLGYPLVLHQLGPLDLGTLVGGYLSVFLVGACSASVGLAASAWTSRPAVALMAALSLIGLPALLAWVDPRWSPLSVLDHAARMGDGAVDALAVALPVAVCVVALQLAIHGLEARRLS